TYVGHLWHLPMDLNSGKVTGPLQPIAHGGGDQRLPASSTDGKVLAYTQSNPGGIELRVRNADSGRDAVLLTQNVRPKVSPDGTKIAYSGIPLKGGIYMMEVRGGQARKLSEYGDNIHTWTPDGHYLVFHRSAPYGFFLYDLRSGKELEMISHPSLD